MLDYRRRLMAQKKPQVDLKLKVDGAWFYETSYDGITPNSETSGSRNIWFDSSGNENHAILRSNGTTWQDGTAAAAYGHKGYNFNGAVSQWHTFPSKITDNKFTFIFSFSPRGHTMDIYGVFMRVADGNGTIKAMMKSDRTNRELEITGGVRVQSAQMTYAPYFTSTVQLAIVYDGSHLSTYVDTKIGYTLEIPGGIDRPSILWGMTFPPCMVRYAVMIEDVLTPNEMGIFTNKITRLEEVKI